LFRFVGYTAEAYDALQEGAKTCPEKCVWVQKAVLFTKGCGWGGGIRHSPLTGPAALRCPACAFQALKWALCARGERERKGSSSCDVGGVVSFTSRHGNGQGPENMSPP